MTSESTETTESTEANAEVARPVTSFLRAFVPRLLLVGAIVGSSFYSSSRFGLEEQRQDARLALSWIGTARGRDMVAGLEPSRFERENTWQAARALGGLGPDLGASSEPWTATDLEPLNVPAGLRRLLEEDRAEQVLSFLDRVTPAVRTSLAGYEQWARVETMSADAAARVETVADLEPKSPVASVPLPLARLAEATDARAQGTRLIVRDRRGRLIGRWLAPSSGGYGLDGHPDTLFDATSRAAALGIGPWLLSAMNLSADDLKADEGSIRTTLDLDLSERLQDAFGNERGTVVVLDPNSGAVLAAVSDPKTSESSEGRAFFEDAREPASIAKLITAAAVLRAGLDIDEEVRAERCNGSVRTPEGPLYCPAVLGRVESFARALAASCNSTFARLGLQMGERRMLEEYYRFGFQGSFPLGPDSAMGGARLRVERATGIELARLSVGLDNAEVTPLAAARYAAVFVDGDLPTLRWREARDGWLGLSPTPLYSKKAAPGPQVLDQEWLPIFHEAMLAVTGPRGTARSLAPEGFSVAMKTGTASEPAYGFHVNYIGVAPMPSPKYAFAVRITNRPTSRKVRWAARTVTRRVLQVLADEDAASRPVEDRYLTFTAGS